MLAITVGTEPIKLFEAKSRVSSRLSCPSSIGIVPVYAFWSIYNAARKWHCPISGGILPFISFFPTWMYTSLETSPILVGTLLNLLLLRSSPRICDGDENSGTGPVRSLKRKFTISNTELWPTDGGIVPVNLLSAIQTTDSFGEVPIAALSVPENSYSQN